MSAKARTITLAVLLAVVSIIAVQPSFAQAPSQSGMVTITARGSATQMGSNMGSPSPSANIYLKGTVNINGGAMQLTQMTGILQIGPVFYTVTGGQGQSSNQTATLQLNLQVGGSNPGTLTLQGNLATGGAGNTVLFTPQQSNLEGQYSLWLYGNLWITQTITS